MPVIELKEISDIKINRKKKMITLFHGGKVQTVMSWQTLQLFLESKE